MRFRLALLFTIMFAPPIAAQTVATPASVYQWTEANMAAATAQSATYKHYDPATGTTSTTLTGVTCTANATVPANADCQAPIPALTLGNHTVAISQVISTAESTKSNTVTFQFVVVVQPTNLRIAKLFGFWRGGVLSSRGRAGLRRVQIRDVHVIASPVS